MSSLSPLQNWKRNSLSASGVRYLPNTYLLETYACVKPHILWARFRQYGKARGPGLFDPPFCQRGSDMSSLESEIDAKIIEADAGVFVISSRPLTLASRSGLETEVRAE